MTDRRTSQCCDSLPDSVLLDLETSLSDRVLKVGAIRGEHVFLREGRFDLQEAMQALDRFCDGARCLVGHNIVLHDLKILREGAPALRLLSLPVVDTLFLLCSDDQTNPCLALGMQQVFCAVADGEAPMTQDEARTALAALLSELACRTAAAYLAETDFGSEQARWAFAYVVTWLRVAGSDSVLPAWVRLHNPLVGPLRARLRDVPCDSPACRYCRETHHPETQLERYFGFDGFRPTPPDATGGSLQRAIVLAGMRNESVLAIMPTGGGKSLCFQLPAMVRNFRGGQLTVVVSPLQALMKDHWRITCRRPGARDATGIQPIACCCMTRRIANSSFDSVRIPN